MAIRKALQIERLNEKIEELEETIDEMETSIKNLEEDMDDYQDSCDSIASDIEHDIRMMESDFDSKYIQSDLDDVDRYHRDYQEAQCELTYLEKDLEVENKKLAKLRAKLKEVKKKK